MAQGAEYVEAAEFVDCYCFGFIIVFIAKLNQSNNQSGGSRNANRNPGLQLHFVELLLFWVAYLGSQTLYGRRPLN